MPDGEDFAHLVGKKAFCESPLVEDAPPTVNRPIPVPSVYCDGRGEIHNMLVGSKRINILHSKQGVMRSGDLHPVTQHDFVFEGKVQVWTLQPDGSTQKRTYGPNQYVSIPPYVPHIFYFLQDTVVAEWWEENRFYAWFYRPYRKLVDASWKPTVPGRFHQYQQETTIASKSAFVCSGLVFGFMLGVLYSRKMR